MADMAVHSQSAVIQVADELLRDAQGLGPGLLRYLSASDEDRAAWAEATRVRRAAERASAERKPPTLDALLDALGFSREYAEHLVQPYCQCGDSSDGWDYCQHSYDEGVRGA